MLWFRLYRQANIGIATGSASGLIVVDVDKSKGGLEQWARLEQEHGALETLTARTGGGGLHVFLRYPGNHVANSVGRIASGIDIRGDGGYVVAPPSKHASGDFYQWRSDPEITSIREAPAWLLNMLQPPADANPGPATDAGDTIPEGRRNDTLFRMASSLRGKGLEEDEILARLREENARRCQPPLPNAELEVIAQSVAKYAPGRKPDPQAPPHGERLPRTYPRTDAGNAELFADMFRDELRYDADRGSWYAWDRHRWVVATHGQVEQFALQAARRRQERGRLLDSDIEKQAEVNWARGSESGGRLSTCVRIARGLPTLATRAEDWDADPWLLGVPNGVLDLRTGTIRDGRPSDRITMRAGTAYDADAESPTWIKFLQDVFESDAGMIHYVHKAVGYSLTGDTSEHAYFLCHGSGANGKTTLLEVLGALLGDYAQNAPVAMLEVTRAGGANPEVARLVGQRFVTVSELSHRVRLDEARIKALTGGDTLAARPLYGNYFEFTPVCKLWVALNHLPDVEDSSHAYWRRVRLVPFKRTFTRSNRDLRMKEKLLAELPGVLRWAVEGCLLWAGEGLRAPELVQKGTQTYRDDMDSLTGFIRECCVLGSELSVKAGELRSAYVRWCKETGCSPLAEKAWVSALRSTPGVTRKKAKHAMVWLGVGLQDDVDSVDQLDQGKGVSER